MSIFIVKSHVFLKKWAGKAIFIARRIGESFFREPLIRFFPILLAFFCLLGTNYYVSAHNSFGSQKGILGGPTELSPTATSRNKLAMLEVSAPPDQTTADYTSENSQNSFVDLKNSAFSNTGSILGETLSKSNGFFLYTTQKGDTLFSISNTFGVSTNTVAWANASLSKAKAKKITPNQQLIILPVSGVLYQVAPKDTLESLAATYGINPQEIKRVNNLPGAISELSQGQKIIIPDGKPQKELLTLIKASRESLPKLNNFFIFPTEKSSWNWGMLHYDNAVDIANVCGTPIYAAANGLVTDVGSPSEWNDGYGGFVKVEHQNSTETLYAHTEENTVSVGTIVSQGDIIAKIGRSGNVHGPTGCHMHFEVRGAMNPFAK